MTEAVGQYGNSYLGYLGLARDIGEAASFATYFTGSPAAKSTPHLYISALATWSQDTSLSQNWKSQFTHIPVFKYSQGSIDLPLMTVLTEAQLMGVAFSSEGMQIVSGSNDSSLQLWDASTGFELKKLKGHTGSVNSVAFSNDGRLIVSGSFDKSVRVWNASTGREMKKLMGHVAAVNSVMFSSDDAWIVSGSDDNSVRVWNLTDVELNSKELKGHTKRVNSVTFSKSSNGMRIVSGSDDNSVRVWDALTGMELEELKLTRPH